jgi:hypothetical protein
MHDSQVPSIRQRLDRRPGTWGAGFLVPSADAADGFVAITFEHDADATGVPATRRRIRDVAAEHGVIPCTRRSMTPGPSAFFCFDVDPLDIVFPHVLGHVEWCGPDAGHARALLKRLGLLFIAPDEFVKV